MRIVDGVRSCQVTRIEDGRVTTVSDAVAAEAPLEVRLNGEPFSVIMRTPGADRDLVAGFLFTEGAVSDRSHIAAMDPVADGAFDVTLSAAHTVLLPDLLGGRRQVTMNSSCGMCGRRSLDALHLETLPGATAVEWTISPEAILAMPAALRLAQDAFSATGGLHAAGLFSRDGHLDASAEDVGRHNAVDKLIGRMWLEERLPLRDHVLFVSGRLSFEIVQKALLAGIPIVAAVSAPSSMAVDFGDDNGLTLVGFVRQPRFNVYSHPERIST